MKISWIKSYQDNDSFNMMKSMGFNVVELKDLEDTDKTIQNLIDQKYKTIFITNEVAGFSENIMKKYHKDENIKIIITPSKKW